MVFLLLAPPRCLFRSISKYQCRQTFFTAAVRSVVIVAAIAGAWGCGDHQDEAIRTIRIFDLLKALPRANIQAPAQEYVVARTGIVGKEQRDVIFMHPPSRAEFPPVQVYADSILAFAIAIQEEAWDKAGDGVEFSVQVKGSDPVQKKVFSLYSRYIDPKHNIEDRRWVGVKIPLRRFAGQAIRVVLSTSPGPMKNADFDWAIWGEPQILLK